MKKAKILIKHARTIDPANKLDAIRDILIEGAKISQVAGKIAARADRVIDASDKIVIPGIIDMHVHLREPGREDKETIASGTMAAVKGGVTTVLAMPNTQPAIDSLENIGILKKIINQTAKATVLIVAAITKARLGKELVDIAKLKQAGVIAISDDGTSVDDAGLFLRALRQARKTQTLVICHCEDKVISGQGVVNLGLISTRMGLRGIPKAAEYQRVQRDIQLAKKAGARIHIAHLSCRESVAIVAKAKKSGIRVSAETAPHYYTFSEEAAVGYDTNMKMNPPLRSKDDLEALRQGLRDGTIDVIASDHAPHTENEKDIEFDRAEFGVIGLETELAVSITELVETGILSWPELVAKLTMMPAKILGINKGTLSPGVAADLVVVDPYKEWVVKKEEIISQSKNSPFLGRRLKGVIEYTFSAGEIVYAQAQ